MNENRINKIDQKIELAKKKFYNFENSAFVFNSISTFWFLSKEANRSLTQLSTHKLFSDFVFSYLQFLSEIIEKKFNIENISSCDLLNTERFSDFERKISSIAGADIVLWVNDVCLPTLRELVKRLNVTSYGELARLANLLQGETRFLKNISWEEDNELLAYDIFYKIVDKIGSYGFISILDRTLFDQRIWFETNGEQVFFSSVAYSLDKEEIVEGKETTIKLSVLLAEVKIKQVEKQALPLESVNGG
jgi:hypothetical protein